MNAEQKTKIINGKLEKDQASGDGKRMFIIADNNDGWEDLRIEIDTDDCDSAYAEAFAQRLMDCVNACAGIEDLKAINPS